MNDHVRMEELIAAEALGGLGPEDLEEFHRLQESHGDECPECRRLGADYAEVSGRLGFALDPAQVPEGMEDRVADLALDRAAAPHEELRPRRLRSLRPTGALRRIAAAGAAAALLVAGGVGGYLIGRPSSPSSQAVVSLLSARDARLVRFSGPGAGNLAVAYRPGRSSGFVVGSGVPAAPSGHVYELWTFRGRGAPVPSGTFQGTGATFLVDVEADLSRARKMAVTVERMPGTKRPTKTPIFTAPISSV